HPGRRLPRGQGEGVTDPAPGRPATRPVVPDGLRGDIAGGRVDPQAGATTGERVRAGRGEVRVGLPVAHPVAAAVVTRGRGYRDAERGGIGEPLVDRGPRLAGPGILGLAPADAHRRRGRVRVYRRGDRVHEAAVAVRREVDDLARARRRRPGDLDVQQ